MSVSVKQENKVIITTPRATVVMVNGSITVMKVCRPKSKDHDEERDILFGSFTEFREFVSDCGEVLKAVEQEWNK